MNLEIALCLIAEQVFREQADKDYIAARAAYRMDLREQFLWAALQACEKYLKSILLYNQKSARYSKPCDPKKEFRHDLDALFNAVKNITDLDVNSNCPDWMPTFLTYLKKFGENRYLTISTYTMGYELRKLDETVWALRRYCQKFCDWEPQHGIKIERLQFITAVNNPQHWKKPIFYKPFGAQDGFLEKVLKRTHNDFTRTNLVWKNFFFATRQRSKARNYVLHSSSEIPPQNREWFTDKLKNQVKDYVKL
jgi:hypothetical protein